MDWSGLLKLLHVALAMALVTGVIGRWLLLRSAARSEMMDRTEALLEASDPFEMTVRVSSMLVVVVGLLTAWAQGYPWLGLTTGWMLVALILSFRIAALVPTVFMPRGRRFAVALDGDAQRRPGHPGAPCRLRRSDRPRRPRCRARSPWR